MLLFLNVFFSPHAALWGNADQGDDCNAVLFTFGSEGAADSRVTLGSRQLIYDRDPGLKSLQAKRQSRGRLLKTKHCYIIKAEAWWEVWEVGPRCV